MMLVTLDQVRAQCRANDDEDDQITLYANAAEAAAIAFLNRNVYTDADALKAAIDGVPEAMATANAAKQAAYDAARGLEDATACCIACEAADYAYGLAVENARRTYAGMVVNDYIRAAVLLIAGHLYRNREEVVIGTSAVGAVQLPVGAYTLLWPYRVGLGV